MTGTGPSFQKPFRARNSKVYLRFLPPALLLLFFVVMAAIVSTAGEFPLNDDWSFYRAVKTYLETGSARVDTLCAASIPHIFAGVLTAKLFGLSYEAFRVYSLCFGLVGAVALYGACRQLGQRSLDSLFLALLFAGNPIMCNLYFGFMSDCTALPLLPVFLLLYLQALKKSSINCLVGSALVLLVAVMVRQSFAILGLVYLALLVSRFGSLSRRISACLSCLLPQILCAFWVDRWLSAQTQAAVGADSEYSLAKQMHANFISLILSNPLEGFCRLLGGLGEVFCYLGVFLAPALLAIVLASLARRKVNLKDALGRALLTLSLVLTAAACAVFKQHKLMPFEENVWRVTAVGAQGLMGIAIAPLAPRHRQRLTAASVALAFLMLSAFIRLLAYTARHLARDFKHGSTWGARRLALTISFLVTVGFLAVESQVKTTDRYLLLALIPALLVLSWYLRVSRIKLTNWLSLSLLAFMLAYSICGAQDYLSSNRAIREAINSLEGKGISYREIDGGAEYNIERGFEIYSSNYRGEPPRCDWRWWKIRDDKYIVSFSTIPDYVVVSEHRYYSLMTRSEHVVYCLKRVEKGGAAGALQGENTSAR